jgi:hypothetical protein
MNFQDRVRELLNYCTETGVFTWRMKRRGRARVGTVAGTKHPKGYIRISIDHVDHLAHRLAWIFVHGPIDDSMVIDHINGNRSDNRIENLRVVTGMQNANNQQTRLAGARKAMLGASFHKPSGKWISRVKINGKDKYLGLFDTPEQANQAYLAAKREFAKDLRLRVELL